MIVADPRGEGSGASEGEGESAANRSAVPGLERGLNVLRLFKRARPSISPPEMARELGIPRSTVHRLVQTLEEMGFLRRVERAGAYALGPAVLTIGFEYLGSLDIVQLSNPVLERLRDATGCSTHLAVRNGREVVYLSRFASRGAVASNISVGTALPAHGTVMGRMILADLGHDELFALYGDEPLARYTEQTPTNLAELEELLAEDRERGFGISKSFFERGITSVAAPVRDRGGKVIAAINATVFELILEAQLLASGGLCDEVCAAAREISDMLGAPGIIVDRAAEMRPRFGT
jgi:DNA-binding IclR family transcriptional regulator